MLKQFFHQRAAACLIACAVLLTACGGGGGGSTSPTTGGTTGPTTAAALTFNPGTATVSTPSGTSTTVTVNASVNRPADFNGTVYAKVVDTTGVLLPTANIVSQTPSQYSAVLQTSASLTPGNYKGNFTVNLCRDQACSQHFPGSPMQLPYDITVLAGTTKLVAQPNSPLFPTFNLGGLAPSPVTVAVQAGPLNWTATTTSPWLILKNASGTGNGSFAVEFDTSKATVGVLSGIITVASTDGQQIVLNASLTTNAQSFALVSQTGMAFTAINGAPIDPHQFSFNLDGGGNWTAESNAAWLGVTPSSGSLPGTFALTVDPAKGSLASGHYVGNLMLHSPNAKDGNFLVSLDLTKPTLTVSADTVTFGGTFGRDFKAKDLMMQLNTMKNSWPWTFSPLPSWASVSARSSQVNEDGTTIQITPNADSAPVGSTNAVVNATVQVNGDTVVRPVVLTMNRDQKKVLPAETGVAMVSVPGWSRLIRNVDVRDNFGYHTAWTATSNQPWLTIARYGDSLTLTGDPTGLPVDSISYATVTLTTTSVGVTTPEVIRVALWKGSATPAGKTEIRTTYTKVLADVIRPLVYVHNGGSTLDAYNVYTGQKVASSAALGSALGDMAISPNGDRLYVYDMLNRNVLVLNAQTLAKQDSWSLRSDVKPDSGLLAAHPNGEEIVLTSAGDAFRASTGQRFSTQLGTLRAVTKFGRLYTTTGAFDLDFTSIAGGTLHTTYAGPINSDLEDIAPSYDAGEFFTASAFPYKCQIFSTLGFKNIGSLPGGLPYPNNVEVDSLGRSYCGIQGANQPYDVWMHNIFNTQVNQFKFAGDGHGLIPRQMVVSSDGMMLIGLTNDPMMAIIAVGP